MDSGTPTKHSKNSFDFRMDYRLVIGILLAVIIAMLLLWRPWESRFDADSRTVTVTGEAKVTAVPDEYIFTPVYEFKDADREVVMTELSNKSEEIVGKLKELGVSDAAIKTSSDGYDYPMYEKQDVTPTYSLRLTVTINDNELAKKVQDYIVSTTPTGAVSPQFGFSEAKRKELESKARDEATNDARSKAEQSAKNLGFDVGSVKEVTDGAGFDGGYPMLSHDMPEDTAVSSLGLQPGENDIMYRVNVVYFVK